LGPKAKEWIRQVGEINSYKFGRVTPGTKLPIVSQQQVLESKPDYILILPWHFKKGFEKDLANFISNGGSVIYPLPNLNISTKHMENKYV
jgi:hypothetical protein